MTSVPKHGQMDAAYVGAVPMRQDMTHLCQHEWVNCGFTSIKMVCKKCDTEKPDG